MMVAGDFTHSLCRCAAFAPNRPSAYAPEKIRDVGDNVPPAGRDAVLSVPLFLFATRERTTPPPSSAEGEKYASVSDANFLNSMAAHPRCKREIDTDPEGVEQHMTTDLFDPSEVVTHLSPRSVGCHPPLFKFFPSGE